MGGGGIFKSNKGPQAALSYMYISRWRHWAGIHKGEGLGTE